VQFVEQLGLQDPLFLIAPAAKPVDLVSQRGVALIIEALTSSGDTAAATGWWFSAETQTEMRKLQVRLTKS
jgi:hypothetical protein